MQTHPPDSGSLCEEIKKSIFVSDLRQGDKVASSFLVQSKQIMVARNGKPYLSLVLSDSTGSVDTRIWENVDTLQTSFAEGQVVFIAGRAHYFQNRLQLVVEHLTPATEGELDPKDFLPVTEANLEEAYEELVEIFRNVENPFIKKLALELLEDPEIASRYKICPAAKVIHHAFIGGLLLHSLQLIKLVDSILVHYKDIDRSILVFGAAFHDFGKIYELAYQGNFGYTDEGRLVGHIAIAVSLLDRKMREISDFPKELEWQLKHLILSHHGRLEYGSPKRPHTIEAQILAQLDDLDSKINSIQTFMQAEHSTGRWTPHHKAYDQYYYKPDKYLGQ